jgi:thiol-disulfide isomerase/thioredoxin
MSSDKLSGVGHLESVDVDRETGRLKTEAIGAGNKPVLCMVYADYCGHCKTAAPAFKKVHDKHKQKKVFMCALQTDDKNPLTQELMRYFPAILKKSGVEFRGVPTYVVYKNGAWSEFAGGRSEAELEQFIAQQ